MLKQHFIVVATCIMSLHSLAQQYGSLKDSRDGRVYKTVKIGEQVWMAENLNVERFRNGDLIPHAKTEEEWINASVKRIPAWCFYNNDPINSTTCGKLYNWYAVNDPRGLAPIGWRIPSEADWNLLVKYLGGSLNETSERTKNTVAHKLKNSFGWYKDGNGNNSTGLSCNPCGSNDDGQFFGGNSSLESKYGFGQESIIWSSTQANESSAEGIWLNYEDKWMTGVTIFPKRKGASIRCIREK